jgi:hypothetical protein
MKKLKTITIITLIYLLLMDVSFVVAQTGGRIYDECEYSIKADYQSNNISQTWKRAAIYSNSEPRW